MAAAAARAAAANAAAEPVNAELHSPASDRSNVPEKEVVAACTTTDATGIATSAGQSFAASFWWVLAPSCKLAWPSSHSFLTDQPSNVAVEQASTTAGSRVPIMTPVGVALVADSSADVDHLPPYPASTMCAAPLSSDPAPTTHGDGSTTLVLSPPPSDEELPSYDAVVRDSEA